MQWPKEKRQKDNTHKTKDWTARTPQTTPKGLDVPAPLVASAFPDVFRDIRYEYESLYICNIFIEDLFQSKLDSTRIFFKKPIKKTK